MVYTLGIVAADVTRDCAADSSLKYLYRLPPQVDYDPRAAYFRQMKYGLYVRMALLAITLHKA